MFLQWSIKLFTNILEMYLDVTLFFAKYKLQSTVLGRNLRLVSLFISNY